MAPVKFERVVSVSSEDPAHPAENLLKSNYSDKKWKCKAAGEKQSSVVIQLETPVVINAVDIGNHGSAFIEIFVAKSSNPDDFKILVAASSLMTLQEAKLGENVNKVRFFKGDSLAKPICLEKWDRVKLVCSQPYNKVMQYGLSFVVVHSKMNSSSECVTPVLGKFSLKPKEDDIAVGTLFAKRKEPSSDKQQVAAAIRAASTSGVIQKNSPKISGDSSRSYENSGDRRDVIHKDRLNQSIGDEISSLVTRKQTKQTPKAPKRKVNGPDEQGTSGLAVNGTSSKGVKDGSKKKDTTKKRSEKPFNKLMEGVIFTISGFQNPYRSDLRSKAITMGARYKPDWDNSCTHLLCAFPNTPKFNQVLGHGKIVTKEWVENCHSRRMRLPWRRFALHPPDKKSPESEEEIFEYIPRPPTPVDNRRRLSSGSSAEDTEEEIESCRLKQLQKQKENSNVVNSRNNDSENQNEDIIQRVEKVKDPHDGVKNGITIEKGISRKEKDHSPSPRLDSSKLKENRNPSVSPLKKFKKQSTSSVANSQLKEASGIKTVSKENNKKPVIMESMDSGDIPSCSSAFKGEFEEIYEMETEEEDELSDSKQFNLPLLPVIFEGINFYICDDVCSEEKKKLQRYIIAHKGSILESISNVVTHIISRSSIVAHKVKNIAADAVAVAPDWVWIAHDCNCLPPTSDFKII